MRSREALEKPQLNASGKHLGLATEPHFLLLSPPILLVCPTLAGTSPQSCSHPRLIPLEKELTRVTYYSVSDHQRHSMPRTLLLGETPSLTASPQYRRVISYQEALPNILGHFPPTCSSGSPPTDLKAESYSSLTLRQTTNVT